MECTIESGKTPTLYTELESSQKLTHKQPSSYDDKPLTGTGSYNTQQLGRAAFQNEQFDYEDDDYSDDFESDSAGEESQEEIGCTGG